MHTDTCNAIAVQGITMGSAMGFHLVTLALRFLLRIWPTHCHASLLIVPVHTACRPPKSAAGTLSMSLGARQPLKGPQRTPPCNIQS